jgi:hypothetical protein
MQTEFFTHLHQIDALARVNLGLAVQRQMVRIFEHNLTVCDPWRLFGAARHALPPQNFTGSILPFAFTSYFPSTLLLL